MSSINRKPAAGGESLEFPMDLVFTTERLDPVKTMGRQNRLLQARHDAELRRLCAMYRAYTGPFSNPLDATSASTTLMASRDLANLIARRFGEKREIVRYEYSDEDGVTIIGFAQHGQEVAYALPTQHAAQARFEVYSSAGMLLGSAANLMTATGIVIDFLTQTKSGLVEPAAPDGVADFEEV